MSDKKIFDWQETYLADNPLFSHRAPSKQLTEEVLSALSQAPTPNIPSSRSPQPRIAPKIISSGVALILGATIGSVMADITPDDQEQSHLQSDPPTETPIPIIQTEVSEVCTNRDQSPIEFPNKDQTIDILQSVEFVESNREALMHVLTEIETATSITDAYEIAQIYFATKSVPIVFYSNSDSGTRTLNKGLTADLDRHKSQMWHADVNTKKENLRNTVRALASLPRAFVDAFDNTIFYVPENLIHFGGMASVPGEGLHNHFSVVLSLEDMANGHRALEVLYHELGHRLHFEVCGTQSFHEDPVFLKLNDGSSYRVPHDFVNEYARDGGIPEDFAESLANLMVNGEFIYTHDSGDLDYKYRVVLDRIVNTIGLAREEVLSVSRLNEYYMGVRDFSIQSYIDVKGELGRG